MKSVFVDSPENDLGSSEQFIGNFLETPGDLSHIVKNKIWVTSDTHFHHRNILKYEAESRPFKDVFEMDSELIRRWNERVRDVDVVFHLGDFAFAGKTFIATTIPKLHGRKFLLLGNHDRDKRKVDWIKCGFSKVFERPFLMDGKFIFSHEPLQNIPDGKVNIFGHVHGHHAFKTFRSNSCCVCVERWNCAPVEYGHIKQLVSI